MKASILRQAGFCRAALSAAPRVHLASRSSPSAAAFVQAARGSVAQWRPVVPALHRFYSAEAAVSDDLPSSTELITRFADLTKIGVHDKLVASLTQGMKYETMTDVQSQTIAYGLQGKDMYVLSPRSSPS